MAQGISNNIRGNLLAQFLSKWKTVPINFWIGAIILLTFVLVGIFAPLLAPYDFEKMHYEHLRELPSKAFSLGTDRMGRDVLSRTIMGTRTTLAIAAASTALALFLCIIVGSVSAYFGGRVDNIIMRLNDILISFPTLIFAMLVIGVLGPGMFNAVLAIGLLFTPGMARVVRSTVLNVVNLEYIDAAKLRGESALSIIVGEILPNIYPTLIVEGAVRLGHAILVSSSLGYIGLGPPPPTPDWGLMASEERMYMLQNPWPVFAPCIAIVLSVIGVNLFGDGLKTMLVAKKSSRFA